MNNPYNILIIEDDRSAGKVIAYNLKELGYKTHRFENAEDGLLFFQRNPVDLALVDYRLPGISGEEFFARVKEANPMLPVIFMTAIAEVKRAVHLLNMGAFTYLTKPLNMEELVHNISRALEKAAGVKEKRLLQTRLQQGFSFKDYIFDAPKMQPVMDIVMRAAASHSNILITGESGTGKDLIANIVHHFSKRKEKACIKVNLSALPETLLEAELFGAYKGAYTGSVSDRIGRFQEADNGTIFLDEIGELSPAAQVKLLRVIQEKEITPLGSNKPVKINIRLITATNKPLMKLVQAGTFREDLYYRLNVINIHLPPLRERKEDIPPLIDSFIKKYNQQEQRNIKSISKDALNTLMKYPFPGNIRELENIIERSLVLARDEILCLDDLPVFVTSWETFPLPNELVHSNIPLPQRIDAIERSILFEALEKNQYHQTRTAKELGISEARLRYKMRSHQLSRN